MASINENSPAGYVLVVTIPNPAANVRLGAAGTTDADGAELFTHRAVKSCYINQISGDQVYMAVGRAATVASTSFKLPAAGTVFEFPIQDLAKLNFIGTAGDVVQILGRT